MSGGSQNTVTQNSVSPTVAPYYSQALQQGQNLLGTGGPQYYPGQQVADFTPLQQAGFDSIANSAMTPNASQGAQAANEYETSGALLNPSANPYLQGTFKQAANQVQNQLGSEFAQNGSNVLNSLPVQSDEMNNLATSLYGGAYQQGLTAMTQASALAPSIDQGTYMPGQELLSAGGAGQQQSQNEINAAMQRYNYTQQLPYNMLSWYSGLLGQNASPFGSSSSQGSGTNNPWMTAAGVGLDAAALYGGSGAAAAGAGAGLLGGAGGAGLASDLGLMGEGAAMAA